MILNSPSFQTLFARKLGDTISNNMEERILLVDEHDKEEGFGNKMETHREGRLHRSFSIFVFNHKGELLMQQRAKTKYHSGGLWSNTCCSHQREGETLEDAIHRRLQEEMGFDTALKELFTFTYKVKLDHDLFEHEYDHVFTGTIDGNPTPNPEEVDDWKFVDLKELQKDIKENPDSYTAWLRIAFDRVLDHLK